MAKLVQNLPWPLSQTSWASAIQPVLNSPLAQPVLLQNVALKQGSNTVNHLLGQKLTGWIPVRFHGTWAAIADLQDSNQTPALTLILESSAAVTVDLIVF